MLLEFLVEVLLNLLNRDFVVYIDFMVIMGLDRLDRLFDLRLKGSGLAVELDRELVLEFIEPGPHFIDHPNNCFAHLPYIC